MRQPCPGVGQESVAYGSSNCKRKNARMTAFSLWAYAFNLHFSDFSGIVLPMSTMERLLDDPADPSAWKKRLELEKTSPRSNPYSSGEVPENSVPDDESLVEYKPTTPSPKLETQLVEEAPDPIAKYGPALETAAVATMLEIMTSSKCTPSERLAAVGTALRARGKAEPKPTAPATPPPPLVVFAPMREALAGLPQVAALFDRTPMKEAQNAEYEIRPEVRVPSERPSEAGPATDNGGSETAKNGAER